MTLKISALFALLLTTFVTQAGAETAVFQGLFPTGHDATYIRSDNPALNYGRDYEVIVGKTTAPALIHGLFSYNIANIPAGSTITNVTLTLTASRTSGIPNQSGSVSLELYDLVGRFGEGFGDAAGSPAGSSSTSWSGNGIDGAWATPGGDYTTLLSSTLSDPTTNTAGVLTVFSSTPEFVSAAQWALDSRQPFTFLMKLNAASEAEDARRAFFFVSDETLGFGVSVSRNSPKLTIEYVPEPGTAALLAGSTIALLSQRRRRNSLE